MINYYKRNISDKKLETIDSFKIGCWINVTNPTQQELELLSKNHNLDIELLSEGTDPNELPRLDVYEDITYIYVKTISKTANSLNTLLIVIGKDFFLTISKENVESLNQIISGKFNIITTQRFKSLIKILSLINDDTEKKVISVVKNVQIKKNSTINLKDKDLEVLLNYEDFLNNLVSMYNYTTLLYSKLIKNIKFFEEDKDDLEDLMVESEEGLNLCKNSLNTISNITSYYSIILSNKLNKTIKLLTAFTILINIPASIGALYGMNVSLPFQYNNFIFYYIIGIITLLSTIFILYIRKKDLI